MSTNMDALADYPCGVLMYFGHLYEHINVIF